MALLPLDGGGGARSATEGVRDAAGRALTLAPTRTTPYSPRIGAFHTSVWIASATFARPSSGFVQVKASGMEFFLSSTNARSRASMSGSIAGAS